MNSRSLHVAAQEGNREVVLALLNKNVEVNGSDAEGRTPLHLAAIHGRTDVAELLILRGGDVNAVDNKGETPLHYAAFMGHVELSRLLLEHRADIDAQDKDGETALKLAKAEGHINLMGLLDPTLAADFTIPAENLALAGIARSQRPTELVFRPTGSIQWPKRCVGCFSYDYSNVTLNVHYASDTVKAVGWVAGGVMFRGVVEGIAVGMRGEVSLYTIPVCGSCKKSLSRLDLRDLASSTGEAYTSILHRYMENGFVLLTFSNADYDAAFRSANVGLVYNSVDECLAAETPPLMDDGAATAFNAAQGRAEKQVLCPGCERMMPSGDLVCTDCGHTQWKRIVSYFLVGLALLGIGYQFCGTGFWRWLWWILGVILSLTSIHGIVQSIRWRKEPQ